MYNSRPRYDRYMGRVNLPENYSGNAFSAEQSDNVIKPEEDIGVGYSPAESEIRAEEKIEKERAPEPQRRFRLDVGRFLRGGIGMEELLIIGLILLIAQSEENDDIILLLALLLFIK